MKNSRIIIGLSAYLVVLLSLFVRKLCYCQGAEGLSIMDQQQSNINMMVGPVQKLYQAKNRYLKYIGTNLSGAEFGKTTDELGTTYQYPSNKDVDYFASYGFNIFRIPLRWERMQRSVGAPLDLTEIALVQSLVKHIASKNLVAILDIHNQFRYESTIVGGNDTTNVTYATPGQFASFCGDFIKEFTPYYDNLQMNIMNEPNQMETKLMVSNYNKAIAAIREAGFPGVLQINGNAWSGCYSWDQTWYGGKDGQSLGGISNSKAMLNIIDPKDNIVFDCHNYFNSDNSGDDPTCINATVGVERLELITAWLKKNKLRGFVGESGGAMSPVCLDAVKNQLDYLNKNSDVWLGMSWWSAGPKWGNYYASIQPITYTSQAKNQVELLRWASSGSYVGT